jgi:hypothetical protein
MPCKLPTGNRRAEKILHLLTLGFFALKDDKIAKAYNCNYDYIPLMQEMKKLAQILTPVVGK